MTGTISKSPRFPPPGFLTHFGMCSANETWTDTFVGTNHPKESESYSDDATGVTYSVETGLRLNCTDELYLYGAVQLWGTIATPGDSDELSGKQMGTTFRVGIGISF